MKTITELANDYRDANGKWLAAQNTTRRAEEFLKTAQDLEHEAHEAAWTAQRALCMAAEKA